MENKKKTSKKSKIFITIALVLVALIICTIVILPEIKLNYVKKLCNEEYEQECNQLIKNYKKETKSFLGIDIYNPPVSTDSFSISTKVSEIETDYGYCMLITRDSSVNKADVKAEDYKSEYSVEGY